MTSHQLGFTKDGVKGWLKYFRHHGRYHYFDYEFKSICGQKKVSPEDLNKCSVIENPRESKQCHSCLKCLNLPIPEIKRIA